MDVCASVYQWEGGWVFLFDAGWDLSKRCEYLLFISQERVFFPNNETTWMRSFDWRVKPNANSCTAVCGIDHCRCVLQQSFLSLRKCSSQVQLKAFKKNVFEEISIYHNHIFVLSNPNVKQNTLLSLNFATCTPKHKRAVGAFAKSFLPFFSTCLHLLLSIQYTKMTFE